jgi:hypothetical protein
MSAESGYGKQSDPLEIEAMPQTLGAVYKPKPDMWYSHLQAYRGIHSSTKTSGVVQNRIYRSYPTPLDSADGYCCNWRKGPIKEVIS